MPAGPQLTEAGGQCADMWQAGLTRRKGVLR